MTGSVGLDLVADLGSTAREWDALASRSGSPFLTASWFAAWRDAFDPRVVFLLRHAPDGSLRAGAAVTLDHGVLSAAANVHSPSWDVVAASQGDRQDLWRRLAAFPTRRFSFRSLADGDDQACAAAAALSAAHCSTVVRDVVCSPWLHLPASFEELLAAVSRNHRQQLRRRRRALQRLGDVELRTNRGGSDLDRDLDTFLDVEASGWKGATNTAIRCHRETETFYRRVAATAAAAGSLRLRLLELDGTVLAADLALVCGSAEYLLKTGYAERSGALSPGFVLRGEVLRAAVAEGLERYEFLGGPDRYKLDWTGTVRRHVEVRGFRGYWRPRGWYERARPVLHQVREAAHRTARRWAPGRP